MLKEATFYESEKHKLATITRMQYLTIGILNVSIILNQRLNICQSKNFCCNTLKLLLGGGPIKGELKYSL